MCAPSGIILLELLPSSDLVDQNIRISPLIVELSLCPLFTDTSKLLRHSIAKIAVRYPVSHAVTINCSEAF